MTEKTNLSKKIYNSYVRYERDFDVHKYMDVSGIQVIRDYENPIHPSVTSSKINLKKGPDAKGKFELLKKEWPRGINLL